MDNSSRKNKIELAYEIAKKYHAGQVDKSGKDYIFHPIAVAQRVKSENEKILALLHDTLEDTSLTLKQLEAYGFDEEILEGLEAITKKENENYFVFINRLKANPLARRVKIADLLHNLDITRLEILTKEDLERHSKYLAALEILTLNS